MNQISESSDKDFKVAIINNASTINYKIFKDQIKIENLSK